MAIEVTVLGCSGTYAAPGNACSGYLVRSGGVTVLLDAGPGTLANLQCHVPVTGVDAVVVSHVHPDHWLELPVLRNALRYVHRRSGLPLYTTREVLDAADHLAAGGVASTFRPRELTDGSEFSVGPLRFRTSRTDHPPETLAVWMSDGDVTVAYTADTGPGWSVAEFGQGIDLVLSEATFLTVGPEEADVAAGGPPSRPLHLTAAEAGRLARDAGARRLVLTHLLPTTPHAEAVLEAADAYGAAVAVAGVHDTFTV